jgi:hypothetical protein
MNANHITKRICRLLSWLIFLVAMLGSHPAFAQAKVLGLFELKQALDSGSHDRLADVLSSDLPVDASKATLDLYYGARASAAMTLGDLARLETNLREWMKSGTSEGSRTAAMTLFESLQLGIGTQLEEAIGIAKDLIATAIG